MEESDKIVMFRTQGNLMMAQVDGDLMGIAKKEKFIKLLAPRVVVISGQPGEQMKLTLVPFGVMSSTTFLNETASNNNYFVYFNSDMIEAEIPREFLSKTIINHYLATLLSAEVPTLSKQDIGNLADASEEEIENIDKE